MLQAHEHTCGVTYRGRGLGEPPVQNMAVCMSEEDSCLIHVLVCRDDDDEEEEEEESQLFDTTPASQLELHTPTQSKPPFPSM